MEREPDALPNAVQVLADAGMSDEQVAYYARTVEGFAQYPWDARALWACAWGMVRLARRNGEL
jgi:hypothetical protein